MSDHAAIDWFARNVHEWPSRDEVAHCWPPSGIGLPEYISLSKDQWLARRAELQNKPSWSSLQRWAKWIFQNGDGFWYATENKPSEPDDFFRSRKSAGGHNALISQGETIGDWRNTLERRPESAKTRAQTEVELVNAVAEVFKPFTSIEDNQEQDMEQHEEIKQQDNSWFERGELPPVGARCEIRHQYWGADKVHQVTILATTREYLIVQYENYEQHYRPADISFRPIRTEREKAIDEMCEVAGLSGLLFGMAAGKLYDAGYRKESK